MNLYSTTEYSSAEDRSIEFGKVYGEGWGGGEVWKLKAVLELKFLTQSITVLCAII